MSMALLYGTIPGIVFGGLVGAGIGGLNYIHSKQKLEKEINENENLWTEEELSGDNANINENTIRSSLPRTQSFSAEDLQKNYSGFDAGQLYFVGRGISFSENGSNTVTLASPYGKVQCSIICGEFTDMSCNFTVNGGEAVTTVNTAPVTFSNSGNGQNRGPSRTVNYARATDSSSGYYNVPVRIAETFAFDMGDIVFTLQSIAR